MNWNETIKNIDGLSTVERDTQLSEVYIVEVYRGQTITEFAVYSVDRSVRVGSIVISIRLRGLREGALYCRINTLFKSFVTEDYNTTDWEDHLAFVEEIANMIKSVGWKIINHQERKR